MSEIDTLHDEMKPLSWLIGRWRGEDGVGVFPTITDFRYGEEVRYFHSGQPYIHFESKSWNAETKKPLHLETGFIRRKTDSNQVALTIASNIGFVELEEGEIKEQELHIESTHVNGMSFFRPDLNPTTKIKRVLRRVGEDLELTLWMSTNKTQLCQHLQIRYKKIKDQEL